MPRKPSPRTRKLVILEDGTLASLAHNKQFLREFPFLKALQPYTTGRPSGCGSCGANAKYGRERTAAFSRAKQSLANMGDPKRRKLKALLNADKVRVTYKSGKRIIQHNF